MPYFITKYDIKYVDYASVLQCSVLQVITKYDIKYVDYASVSLCSVLLVTINTLPKDYL